MDVRKLIICGLLLFGLISKFNASPESGSELFGHTDENYSNKDNDNIDSDYPSDKISEDGGKTIFGYIGHETLLNEIFERNVSRSEDHILSSGLDLNLTSNITLTAAHAGALISDFYSVDRAAVKVDALKDIYIDGLDHIPYLVLSFQLILNDESMKFTNKIVFLQLYVFENGEIFPNKSDMLLEVKL